MKPTLCILSCHNFYPEIAAAIAAEAWDDVTVAAFPARCGRPPLNWDEVRALLPEGCSQVVVLGLACLSTLGDAPADFPPTRTVPQGECFHLVAGPYLVAEAINQGAYLITPKWLSEWPRKLAEMGFDQEQAGEFFHDFACELVLLDTGIDPNAVTHLAALQAAINLPARRIPLGLDYVRCLLVRQVSAWRLAQQEAAAQQFERRHSRELADHVSAMDMLARLAKANDEKAVITLIEELFYMLFAPAAFYYLRVENGIPIPDAALPTTVLQTLSDLFADYAWTQEADGFMLRLTHDEETLGLILVEHLAFPEYRERYLNMALAFNGVCGLAIENARNRRRLLEAEKMSSLGILVAGVAHEINTPLGVGLTAASTLQRQSQQLTRHFIQHSMTHSELNQYLADVENGTRLLVANLERIGQLIDSFRQVAVDAQALEKHNFHLRQCIDEVLHSLNLPDERTTLHIDCGEHLEIYSIFTDWVSIFVNLISNSLKHGFKHQAPGNIRIRVEKTTKKLTVDYYDNGAGLSAEALARIFDPFYSTDLQRGMGLGMHLVYNLISHRLGGSIQCESEAGRGVHFHIEVPQ